MYHFNSFIRQRILVHANTAGTLEKQLRENIRLTLNESFKKWSFFHRAPKTIVLITVSKLGYTWHIKISDASYITSTIITHTPWNFFYKQIP